MSMEGGENHAHLIFVLKSMYPEENGNKLCSGYTVEIFEDLPCKTVCLNKLFGDVNIFSIVVSRKD